jgi:hypothetical protein
MAAGYKFVDTIDELIDSTREFHSKPKYCKEALGKVPKYFVHFYDNGIHKFGLSKFCAFKGIIVEQYIDTYRRRTDGGKTQKHIAWLTGQKWIPLDQIDNQIRQAFDNWISGFYPNYKQDNASFITLS